MMFPAPRRKAAVYLQRLWGQSAPCTAVNSSAFQALRIEIPVPASFLFLSDGRLESIETLKQVLAGQDCFPPDDGMMPELAGQIT
jgi:hypothetical protein